MILLFYLLSLQPPTSFRGQFRISYQRQSVLFPSRVTVRTRSLRYTIQHLQLGATYRVQIRSELTFDTYGRSCYTSLPGEYSDPIYAVTRESGKCLLSLVTTRGHLCCSCTTTHRYSLTNNYMLTPHDSSIYHSHVRYILLLIHK